jgi:hypothetical protein
MASRSCGLSTITRGQLCARHGLYGRLDNRLLPLCALHDRQERIAGLGE